MTNIASRNDAVTHIESLLGADGSRDLAEAVVEQLGWRDAAAAVEAMSDAQFAALLDKVRFRLAARREYMRETNLIGHLG